MTENRHYSAREQKFWKTVREDFRDEDPISTMKRDFNELREFYLSDDQKARLNQMGWFKKSIFLSWWLITILFLRLTSTRRLLLLIGVFLLLISRNVPSNNYGLIILGGLTFFFVLMLELKDKLLARHELAEGHAIQEALMPERQPKVNGWDIWMFTRPANDVGGDLLDFQIIKENGYALAIGDVVGKGLGAALFMAKLQATLRALAPDYASLREFGKKINQIFYRDCLPNSFASLVYLNIASDSNKIRIINAGHSPAVLLTDHHIKEMQKGSPALGILADEEFLEEELFLKKSDILIVYSDGLTDARNEKGDFFGEQRFQDLLPELKNNSTEEIGSHILLEVEKFIGNSPAFDDLSLIILKRTE
jgi:hypothetical protein